MIKLETKYSAIRGEHTAQVKILDIDNLLASETEKKSLSVKYQVTTADVLNSAVNVTNSVVNKVDTYAQKTADYVESLKQPTEDNIVILKNSSSTSISGQISSGKLIGKVLGTSTKNSQVTNTQKNTSGWKTYIYNKFLDTVAFLLRHWVWTFVAIILFILYLTLR